MRQITLLLLTVAVAHASVSVTRTSNDALHPSTMEIQVQLPNSNKQVRIPLTRTDAFEDIPMTVVENGVSRTFSSHQVHHVSHSHYRDIQSKSVISVRHVNGKRQISGHVMHDCTSYFLEPVGDSGHRVTENVRNPEVMARQIDLGKLNVQSHRKRQTITTAKNYTVELHLLLDSTVWSVLRKIYGSDSVALIELHFYYTHILNGIDTTYRNIGTPSISVKCIGITISKTASDDAWMPASLDGRTILTKMTTYISGKTADHFMAFTRKDITGDGSPAVCGMAYVSGVCQDTRVSINEDQGLQSWGTAAHELAHNLGSQHDSNGNTCNASLQNVMAPSNAFYTLDNVANSYQFSACSKNYMFQYINSLGTSSCLLSAQGSRLPQLTTDKREGARMTLDQVCRLAYPESPGKLFLPQDAGPASVCAAIFCQKADGGRASSGGLRAPVGTPCGSRKSCNWRGQCAADASAPEADESCFWGDIRTAKICHKRKYAIEKKWDTCRDSVKKECCSSLKALC